MSAAGWQGTAALERRYRRLLSLYPRRHRRAHAEEMLGVLLAAAADGQRRPRLADAVDLIWCALKIRFRALLRGPADQHWQDALAVVSVVAPLLLLAADLGMTDLLGVAIRGMGGSFGGPSWAVYWWNWPTTVGAALLVLLVLLRARRTAALIALATTAGTVLASTQYVPAPAISSGTAIRLVLGALATVALTVSPGPARGLAILRPRRTALIGAGALALGAVIWGDPFITSHVPLLAGLTLLTVAPAGVAVACLQHPVGRRVVALLLIVAVPLYGAIFTEAVPPFYGLVGIPQSYFMLYLSLLVTGVVVAAAWLGRRRGRGPASGEGPPAQGGLPARPSG
ncbi:MAG TPA: hypothetical protein VH641_04620 [Streptosporangiaceae bacterium]|jgi:hypothetical protein